MTRVDRPRRPAARLAFSLLLLAGAGGALSACSTARNQLATASSLCYPDLPPAAAAVHDRGRLEGVRLVTVGSLARFDRWRQALEKANGGKAGDVCLVAFSGSFTSQDVERPAAAGASGSRAVVAFSSPGNHLLVTFVLNGSPVRFGRRVI